MTPLEIARRAHADRLAARPARDLLARYAATHDAEAFAGLVHQFGPVVLGVCRRILGQAADADDAFQLVFLALARHAGTFRDPAALPAWLHRVSLRVARKLLARRPAVVPTPDPPSAADPFADVAWKDLRRVLDEELDRLPAKYRGPLVACWLDGLTQDEAVARLGVPLTTLKRRLAAGRELLRGRLLRRGVAPVLVAAMVEPTGLRAVVTDELVAGTLALISPGAAIPTGANAVIASAIETGSRPVLALVAVGVLVCAVTAGVLWPTADRPTNPPPPVAPEAAKSGAETQLLPSGPVRLDALGDPLPADARFRLGTDRFRVGPQNVRPGVIASLLSPDQKRIAVAGEIGLTLFDLDTGRVVWHQPTFAPPGMSEVRGGGFCCTPGIVFAPDGTRVYLLSFESSSNSGRATEYAVQVLDAETGRPVARFVRPDKADSNLASNNARDPDHNPGYSDLWFPTGSKHLLVRAGRQLRALDPVAGREVRRTPTPGWVEAVSPDGQQVFSRVADPTGNSHLQTVAQVAADGREVRRYTIDVGYRPVVLSPDGTRLAHSSSNGVGLWDTTTGAELGRGITALGRDALSFTPDGRSLLSWSTLSYRAVVTVDIETRKETHYRLPDRKLHSSSSFVITGAHPPPSGAAHFDMPFDGHFHLLADGKSGVSVSNQITVSRWELGVAELKPLPDPGPTEWLVSIRSADGRVVAAVHKDTGRIDVADGATGTPARTIQTGNYVYSQAISPDGKVLGTLDPVGTFVLWDTATGAQKHVIAREELTQKTDDMCRVGGIAFSPDGATVVASTFALGTAAYDVATGEQRWTKPIHPYSWKKESPPDARLAEVPVFSPDGHVLICSDRYHHPIFRDAKTGDPLDHFALGMLQKGGPSKHPNRLKRNHPVLPVFSNGGGWLGGVEWENPNPSRVVRVAHSAGFGEFRLLPALSKYRPSGTSPFAVGPAGVWVATEDGADVVIWDVATATPVRRLKGHRGTVTHVEWGDDGRTLISSAADRTSLVWDVKPKLPPDPDWHKRWWDDLAGDGPTAFAAVWRLGEGMNWTAIGEKFDRPATRPRAPEPDQLSPDYWRFKRVVLALELAENPLAFEQLRTWSAGTGEELLTVEAKAAYGRLKRRWAR